MIPGTRPARRRRRIAREPCSSRLATSSFVVSVLAMTAVTVVAWSHPPSTRSAAELRCPLMTPDQELVLLFGALHLVALVFACILFWMFMKSETVDPWTGEEEDEGGGGGGNDRLSDPPRRP